jgi:hypothetical protein
MNLEKGRPLVFLVRGLFSIEARICIFHSGFIFFSMHSALFYYTSNNCPPFTYTHTHIHTYTHTSIKIWEKIYEANLKQNMPAVKIC